MKFLKGLLSKILGVFSSGQAEAAFNTVADLVPKALPIVQAIAAITPTRTDDEILQAFAKYDISARVMQVRNTPGDKRGYLLLQLASDVLAKELPNTATSVINAAVQLAVVGVKA